MNSEPARIRPYQPDDLDELYRICLQTADNGQEGTSLFRHVGFAELLADDVHVFTMNFADLAE